MNARAKIVTCLTVAAFVAGAASGLLVAQAGSQQAPDSKESSLARSTSEEQPAKILGTLGNGGTYGTWYTGTPDRLLPDYMPVTLSDGTEAYVRLEEAFPPEDPKMYESSDEGRRLRLEYMEKRAPNARGEITAPAYARDGTTVVGEVVIADISDAEDS